MAYHNPKLTLDPAHQQNGTIRWSSPSNIALLKYWGKHGQQLPRNPSLSFTLSAAATDTTLTYGPKQHLEAEIDLVFRFDGQPRESFAERTAGFFRSLLPIFPFLKQLHLEIDTSNSFPHSAGIASSASGMSALALCLCSLEHRLFGNLAADEEFDRKASYVARLGSGSACRSIYGYGALWGKTGEIESSTDEYAIPMEALMHPVFKSYHNDILIISHSEKSVSSRAGHGLMENNIYAASRYQQARQRMQDLLQILRIGDVERLGILAEAEALTLHALMLQSAPPYILLEPNTVAAIQAIHDFRANTKVPLYFTLDAGPNLHLLYPEESALAVREFVRAELLRFTAEQHYIADRVGAGPAELVAE